MKQLQRLLGCLLGITLFIGALQTGVLADKPAVSTDESVFVNLDYYGQISDYSIVKGVTLNGNTEFIDYGNYKKINNMTDYNQPDIRDSGVKWTLEEGAKRFYYECESADTKGQLPWIFDISYTLNGQPTPAENLAGKSGLVEIIVHAIPNSLAQDYYRNNMILQVAMLVSMEDVDSIEAPGAQLQSFGSHKLVLYMAMPGEEETFHIKIGTQSFETMGVIMAMAPGTLSQLSMVNDLRDAKGKIIDAYHAGYDSYNALLDLMGSMGGGLDQMKGGISSLDSEVLSKLDSSAAAKSMNTLAGSLEAIANVAQEFKPHVETAGDTATDLMKEAKTISGLIGESRDHIKEYQTSISNLRPILKQYQELSRQGSSTQKERKQLVEDLRDSLVQARDSLDGLATNLGLLNTALGGVADCLGDLSQALRKIDDIDQIDPEDYYHVDLNGKDVDLSKIPAFKKTIDTIAGDVNNRIDEINRITSKLINQARDFIYETGNLIHRLQSIGTSAIKEVPNMQEFTDKLDSLMNLISGDSKKDGVLDILDDMLDHTIDAIDEVLEFCDRMDQTFTQLSGDLQEAEDAIKLVTDQEDSILGALSSCQNALDTLAQIGTDSGALLRSFSDNLKLGTDGHDASLSALRGAVDILERSISGLEVTDSLHNTGNAIHDTIEDEKENIESQSNILEIDPDAELKSFTSDKNPTPSSIQVVLRSKEISVKDSKDQDDLETKPQDRGVLGRIADIFIKIYQAFAAIFAS